MKAQSTGRKYNNKQKRGMATLEILIAFAVLILSISAVIMVVFGNQSIAVDSETNNEAISKAKKILEKARADSRADFLSVKDCDDSNPLIICDGTLDPFYNRKLTIDPLSVTQCREDVKSNVSWLKDGRTLNMEFITRLSDIPYALALGGDCEPEPPNGDWAHPTTLNSIDTSPAGIKATDLDVKNKIVYISTDPSAASGSDFFIFDARNTTTTTPPISWPSIDTGPGLEGIDVAGSYAYGANDSKNGQLQIIDISNASNLLAPVLKTTFNVVPGGTDNNTVGTSIFYYNSKIYLGLKKSTNAEFFVIDVTNPLTMSPSDIEGSYEVNATINSIFVRGNYAYIATPNSEELTIIDVNPSSLNFMQRVGGFDAPSGSGNGKSISIVGNKLYLGRTVGNKEFYILDITNPISPTILGSYDVNSSVNDLVISGRYAFFATSESKLEFQVFDISNPSSPTRLGKYNYSEKATGIDYEDNLIYVSSESQDALRIIKSGP